MHLYTCFLYVCMMWSFARIRCMLVWLEYIALSRARSLVRYIGSCNITICVHTLTTGKTDVFGVVERERERMCVCVVVVHTLSLSLSRQPIDCVYNRHTFVVFFSSYYSSSLTSVVFRTWNGWNVYHTLKKLKTTTKKKLVYIYNK